MSSTEYVLTYFEARGLAEPIRWVLAYGGANWKDNRFPFKQPFETSIPANVKSHLRFGQVPLLEFEGKRLVQSTAIVRYLSKKFNLAGNDDFEAAQVDEVTDCARDILIQFNPLFRGGDADKRAELLKEATTACKTKYLPGLEKIARENGGHFVGNGLTFADIIFTTYLYQIKKLFKVDLLEEFPSLKALSMKTSNAPGIKEWVAKRPETAM